MRNDFEFLAAAYCASEFSLAEQRCHRVRENAHTIAIKKRSEYVASELSSFIEENGYQVIVYAPNEPGKEPKTLLFRNQPLFFRGDAYFALPGNAGLFIAPENFESDHSLIIEPRKDGVQFMAGKFDNEYGFQDLINQINMAKRYILENSSD